MEVTNQIEKMIEGYYEKPKRNSTWSGIEVKQVYTPEDMKDIDYKKNIGNPGEYPFTRGIFPNMYRGRIWTRREVVGHGTPAETNERLKLQISQGVTGLNPIRDIVTYWGVDPDHPLAEVDVGKSGVNLACLKDMETMMDGIPLDKVSTVLNCGGVASSVILSSYIIVAQSKGLDISKLRGTISNNSVHLSIVCTAPSQPLIMGLKLATDIIEYCTKYMPLWYTGFVDSYDVRELGCTAAQEVALGLAIQMAYFDSAIKRRLNVDDFARRRTFYVSSQIDFFEEVAKIRAMRRMYARIMKEKYEAKDPESWKFRFAVHTAGSSLTPQQPLNNIIRVAYEALAAVLGGVQSLHCCSYDEPINVPTPLAQRLALRTQQILAYESGVTNVVDPLAGSYYVENLTNKIEEEANKTLQEIDERGGLIEVLTKSNWIQNELDEAALKYQREVESGERTIVGLNAFTIPPEEEALTDAFENPPESTEERITFIKYLRETRDKEKVKEAIRHLRERAQMGEEENLMPPIMEALKADATIGEILGIIRGTWELSYDPLGVLQSPFKD